MICQGILKIKNISRAAAHRSEEGATSKIEEAVLSTNPIMESFGNSKTTRNDNSSRFGKYIEIQFGPRSSPGKAGVEIVGAKMRTYLLERSRLVFQPKGERNYHIFYQLCAACPQAEKENMGLSSWETFHYLNQGYSGVVNGIDDVAEFADTQAALSIVGVSIPMQWDVFKICSALLHIGNIKINDNRGNADISGTDPSLLLACQLLELDADKFRKWMVKRSMKVGMEYIEKDNDVDQATVARDSIAKFIYSQLFDWLVKVVNLKISCSRQSANQTFIGVLDIYGFEHFKKNSFEQFCINYANEKLQQEFTRHVFKLEQEEYVAEGINWSFIDFTDNQPCIDLIESRLGILALLDEESRLPSGADKNFISKLYSSYGKGHQFFDKPKFGETEFVIKHYAIDVSYSMDGFIEKNRDTVTDQQLETLNKTTFKYLKEIIKIEELVVPSSKGGKNGVIKKPTLGSIFKQSLVKLMETLRQTHPHYIRCIKPNQMKEAFVFEAQNVLDQLIACGVLETIKISRAGYPSKETYDKFANRYYILAPSTDWKKPSKDLSVSIAKKNITKAGLYEIGKTKIFFRAGQLAYLEKLRIKIFQKFVVVVQKNYKRKFYRTRYLKLRKAAIMIQSLWRRKVAMSYLEALRAQRRAVLAAQEAGAPIKAAPSIPTNAPISLKSAKTITAEQPTEKDIKKQVLEKENREMLEKVSELEGQVVMFKNQYSKMDSEFKRKANIDVGTINELNALISKLSKDRSLLMAESFEREEEITELRKELEAVKDKSKRERSESAAKIASLEKEIAVNRKQLSDYVAEKYSDEKQTASFFADYPQTEAVGMAAARSTMYFIESAAAHVAASLSGSNTASASKRTREVEFSEPKKRAIRMLESKDLEEEILLNIIKELKIRTFL